MPELPEIEVIRLGLSRKITGLKVQKTQILAPKSFTGNPNKIERQKVLKIWRKAKLLGIELEEETLLIHLKLSGQLIYEGKERLIGGHPTEDMRGKMPNSHTRVIFTFSDGSHLYFNDQRRFGWIKVFENGKIKTLDMLGKLGPEPLEEGFTWEALKQNLLRHKKLPVKAAIMDQSVISGVGNIYANEACFLAKIDPGTKVSEMTGDKQFQVLHKSIITALKEGIKQGGSTRVHFVDPEGHKGYFLDYAYVYERNKKPCKICGKRIEKIILGGRGTYFCPVCQRPQIQKR